MSYRAVPGPCAACTRDAVCCDHRGRALCHDCWHAAREAEVPYKIVRDADGYMFGGTYLKEEAENKAAEIAADDERIFRLHLTYRDDPSESEENRAHWAAIVKHEETLVRIYSAVAVKSWTGSRIAHPDYSSRRLNALVDRKVPL